MRVRIDVVQAHPGAMLLGQRRQRLAQLEHACLHRLAVPEAGAVLDVDAVGAGVLADHQQFLHAAFEQGAGFVQHVADRARDQVAAHAGDDAEAAAVVAAFADLQVGVVPGRELDARALHEARHQVDERVVRLGHVQVHRVHHLLRRVRAGDGQHLGVDLAHQVAAVVAGLGTQAAGDDDTAVLGQRLADGVQAFLHRVVDEAAGVDDDEVGTGEGLAGAVALGAELREDEFGVGQRLGAAERDEADGGRGARGGSVHRGIFPDRRGFSVWRGGKPGKMTPAVVICSCSFSNIARDWSR